MGQFGNQLNSEKQLLTAVFLVFTVTYTLRLFWSLYFIFSLFDQYQENYKFFCTSLALPIVWDVLPIGLLMYFHLRNFTVKSQKQQDTKQNEKQEKQSK